MVAQADFSESVCSISLGDPIPDLPEPIYADAPKSDPYQTHVTVLSNGLRVASAPQFGEFCTVGVCIDAGCRYEEGFVKGTTHFLEKLAFGTTQKYGERANLYSELEKHGGICDCQSTRDTFIYAASCHGSGLDPVLNTIAEASMRSLVTDSEVRRELCAEEFVLLSRSHVNREEAKPNLGLCFGSDFTLAALVGCSNYDVVVDIARDIIKFDNEDMNRDPNPERLLTDWIHTAAYKENTLGFSKFCTDSTADKLNRKNVFSYLKTYFCPERMVVAGVGVDHDELVESANRHFVDAAPIWSSDASLQDVKAPSPDASTARYTGGIVKVSMDLSHVALGPTPMPDLAHFVLGLQGCSYKDADFVPFCVLNALMGGGGSFSAGGPGKGMYTRLYTNVLNRYHWMYNATSYNHAYAETGVYCIHASADPKQLANVVHVIVNEFLNILGTIGEEELARAKKQLQSMLLINLEQRPVMFEDVGRQVLGHGFRKSPLAYMQEIDQVTVSDLASIGERMFSSKPSVVAYGELSNLPDYEKVESALAQKDASKLKSSKMFSFF